MATNNKNTILSKIVAEAKRIQLAHPHMKWTNAIKDASKHIKEGAKTVVSKTKTTKNKIGAMNKKPKFKVGDMVFSYENPNNKRPISIVYTYENDNPKYKISLLDKEGYTFSSKFISEQSISKTSRDSDAKKVKSGLMSVEKFADKWGSESYLNNIENVKKSVSGTKKSVHQVNKIHSIGNLNDSLIKEIERANRGIKECEYLIQSAKERLKITNDNWSKSNLRTFIMRITENKKYYKEMLAKAKKQLK